MNMIEQADWPPRFTVNTRGIAIALLRLGGGNCSLDEIDTAEEILEDMICQAKAVARKDILEKIAKASDVAGLPRSAAFLREFMDKIDEYD